MSLNMPFGVKNLNPHSDANDWYGKYNSLAEAIASVPVGVRDLGLKVGVVTPNGIVEYWWKENTTDAGLVLKDVASISTPQNTIISIGEVVQVNNEYTFQSNGITNYSWIINSVLYSNTTTVITVDYAALGYKRRDMFYFDATNIIKHRQGTEVLTSEQASTPELLPGEIFLSFIDVTDSTSGVTTPVNTEDFVRRTFLESFDVEIVDNYINTLLTTGGQSNLNIYGTSSNVKGLKTNIVDPLYKIYNGKIYIFKNLTGSDITFKHNDNTEPLANTKFLLPNNIDLVIPNNEKIICIANNDDDLEFLGKSWETHIYTHPNHTGDVTSVGDGVQTIANEAVTNAKFRNSTAHTVVGRAGSGNGSVADITLGNDTILGRRASGNVEGLSVAQVQSMINFNSKLDLAPIETTATEITFTSRRIHGTFGTPLANVTFTTSLTGAILNLEQKVYHQSATEPDYPVGFVNVGGVYAPSEKNMIFFEWVGGTRVEYYIVQA